MRRLGIVPTYAECMKAEDLIDDPAWVDSRQPGELPVDGWNAARPCPFLDCRYHLLNGSRGPAKKRELDQLTHACSLQAAEDGPRTQEQVGELMGINRHRVSDIETAALAKLRRLGSRL